MDENQLDHVFKALADPRCRSRSGDAELCDPHHHEGSLPVLAPEEDAEILCAAGFSDVQLFYAAFTFKGWTACA